jgi:predicted ATPase
MSLPVREFRARNYRSLKAIAYPVGDLDVFIGANGAGKTNLYRGLELLRSAAANRLAKDLTQEGGLESTLWAGERKRHESAHLELSVELAPEGGRRERLRYEVAVGFPPSAAAAAFQAEPQIKTEAMSMVGGARTLRLMDRKNHAVMARDESGRPAQVEFDVLDSETVLGRLEDPGRYPELDAVRHTLLQWRFYHGLRTDAGSPLRQPCPAVATPTLASDGSDLAAVFATLVHIRQDSVDLDAAIEAAFPGGRLVVPQPGRMASFGMRFAEFPKRVFEASELSDGALRFLALAGALLAYRLPPFIALNEPEASLHPDLMKPLARLIVRAAGRTQLWLVTHSSALAQAIERASGIKARTVLKADGETRIAGLKRWGEFQDDEGED